MDIEQVVGIVPVVDEQAVAQELEAWVNNGHVDPQREPWAIGSLRQADWVMQKLGEAQQIARQYDDEVSLWGKLARNARLAGVWFEDRLKEWAVAQRAETSRKTFPVAHGNVSTSLFQPSIVVEDEAAALLWASENCSDAVKVERSFLISKAKASGAVRIAQCVSAFKAVDKTTGEVQRIEVATVLLDEDQLESLRVKMDGFVVEPEIELRVVDAAGHFVPGLAVKPGHVTASVGPVLA